MSHFCELETTKLIKRDFTIKRCLELLNFTKITYKLGLIILSMMVLCIASISFSNYKITYDKVKEAAGIELYGCANITTGLLDPLVIEQLASGDFSQAAQTGDLISWTVEHKDIFNS